MTATPRRNLFEGELWIVGTMDTADPTQWSVKGIYSRVDDAIERCTFYDDFVGLLILDKDRPEQVTPWDGCFFPLRVGGHDLAEKARGREWSRWMASRRRRARP